MKNNNLSNTSYLVALLCLLMGTISCSEGDIITVELEFDGVLDNCANTNANTFVFYKLNSANTKTLLLNFTETNFDLIPDSKKLANVETVLLNQTTNLVTYREFSASINPSSYFCSDIPPKENTTTLEYTSTSGTAEISYDFLRTEATDSIFKRTIVLRDITLIGDAIAYRKEFLALGEQEVVKTFTP
ncbi:hypothetical protein ACE939_03870 [Aquimarina sp. W85]|uniref:hypothetical protein n=1 Tax=Aquimarina rhodophyticola TaxID=3342246 RepID=UPI00366ED4D8